MFNREMPTIVVGQLDEHEPLTAEELKAIEDSKKKIRLLVEQKKKQNSNK
jgi:hypothetical protein